MQINSANQQPYADKATAQSKARELRENNSAKTDGRTNSTTEKQPGRDVFIPSAPGEKSVVYKPPVARQTTPPGQTETSAQAGSADGLKTKPQIGELLAKIKAANPEELLSAQQKAASENIAALLEAEE